MDPRLLIPTNSSPSDLKRRRRLAEDLATAAGSGKRVGWGHGLNRLAQGLVSGFQQSGIDRDEEQYRRGLAEALANVKSGEDMVRLGQQVNRPDIVSAGQTMMNQEEAKRLTDHRITMDKANLALKQAEFKALQNKGGGMFAGLPEPPKDYEYVFGPDGLPKRQVVPGSATDKRLNEARVKEEKAEADRKAEVAEAVEKDEIATVAINAVFEEIAKIREDLTAAKSSDDWNWATGMTGKVLGTFPLEDNPAYRARSSVQNVANNTAIQALMAIREASKNGASGFGQLSIPEFEALKKSFGDLDLGLGEKRFLHNLDKVERRFRAMLDAKNRKTKLRLLEEEKRRRGK